MSTSAPGSATLLIVRAADFAARKHSGQRRKGVALEPYVNHLAEVALLLSEATDGLEPELVAAGWLHDTLEDTETRRDELELHFGAVVSRIVAEVTDDKSLPKAERKRLQIERTPLKSVEARLVKLADKTSNLRSLVASPPADWGDTRRADYLNWAEAVVAGCRGLNSGLEREFDSVVQIARAAIAAS